MLSISIRTRTQIGILLLLVFSALSAQAGNTKYEGQTVQLPSIFSVPIKPIKLNKAEIQQLAQKVTTVKPLKAGFQPLTTRSMRVCKHFKSRRTDIKHLMVPVFIVGNDPTSLRWIQSYKNTLNRIHAIGLVVSVNNINELKKIKNRVGNVSLYPVEGNAASQFFGIKCYPVLISPHLIEQ